MPNSKRRRKPSSTHSTRWGWTAFPTQWACEAIGASGVFETLRVYQGRIFAPAEHIERLAHSARTLARPLPQSPRIIGQVIRRMARALPAGDAVIRVMVVPGPRGQSRLVVMGRRLRPYPRRWYMRGVAVTTAITQRCAPTTIAPQAKHMDLLPGVLARLEPGVGATEMVYRTDAGMVAEGTVSNICLITRSGELVSAPPAAGVLAGVTCQVVFALAARLGFSTSWRTFTRHEAWNAAEAFLTNTTFEVLPVVRYDGRVIGTGRPGPWTRKLHAAFRAHVQRGLT